MFSLHPPAIVVAVEGGNVDHVRSVIQAQGASCVNDYHESGNPLQSACTLARDEVFHVDIATLLIVHGARLPDTMDGIRMRYGHQVQLTR